MNHNVNERHIANESWPRCLAVWAGVLLTSVCLIAVGCEKSGPPTIRVEGRVTFEGQPPPKPGKIVFAPIEVDAGFPRRHGTAKFDANGDFTVTSFSEGDGLIPGRYRADIKCWKKSPTPATLISDNYVPPSYKPPELVVKADQAGTIHIEYDVPLNE